MKVKPIRIPNPTHRPARPPHQIHQKGQRALPLPSHHDQPSETLIGTTTTPESEYANLSLQASIKAPVCDEEVIFRLRAVVNFCKFLYVLYDYLL